ncbi:hypothetical protein O181_021593 [Austropuccinia psidii MF-1]|uniref:Uncharacterized protein n=1 Tax=Austropuccinia psidii MF-1 TaxID=1389203 RepID=A0A9Q3CDM7_9BASI|nr:hypothetical protein [Austropuccinia psidii MF-1]
MLVFASSRRSAHASQQSLIKSYVTVKGDSAVFGASILFSFNTNLSMRIGNQTQRTTYTFGLCDAGFIGSVAARVGEVPVWRCIWISPEQKFGLI